MFYTLFYIFLIINKLWGIVILYNFLSGIVKDTMFQKPQIIHQNRLLREYFYMLEKKAK